MEISFFFNLPIKDTMLNPVTISIAEIKAIGISVIIDEKNNNEINKIADVREVNPVFPPSFNPAIFSALVETNGTPKRVPNIPARESEISIFFIPFML